MPQATITISDEQDTEYELLVDFDVLPAEPDVGLMSEGHEITEVQCIKITYNCGGDKRVLMPIECGQKGGEAWFGAWCQEMFEKQIDEQLANTPIEADVPEYDF